MDWRSKLEKISPGNVYVGRLRKALLEAAISYVLSVRLPIRNEQLVFEWMEFVNFTFKCLLKSV